MELNELLKKEYNLTDREIEVAVLVLEGYSNQKIAQKLFLSLPTIKTHVSNVFKKTGAQNRFELMSLIKSDSSSQDNPLESRKSFNFKHLVLIIIAIALIPAVLFIFSVARNFINQRSENVFHGNQFKQEKQYQFSEAELLKSRSIPSGLDSLTVARLYYYIGAVKKDRELWKQVVTDDWSEATIKSTWRMLAEKNPGWNYYYLKTAEDQPDEKKYYFQRQLNGIDNGIPRPIRVIKQKGEWRVSYGQP